MRCFAPCVGLLFWAASVLAGDAPPLLIDVKVIDAMEGPYLEPSEFIFEQNKEYLLVIKNENNFAVNIHYDKFGQNVFTRLLQGAPNVYQTGFGLPSYSKILWHFSPSLAGEYVFHISNSGMNLPGKNGTIVVKGGKSSAASLTEENASEKVESKEKKSWLKSLRFWK